MDYRTQKEHELLEMINNLEKSYDPESPYYKFKYVFYNKVDTPFVRPLDFPEALWNTSLTSDPTLMPIILKGEEIEKRKILQKEVAEKINDSYDYLQKRINALKIRSEKVKSKIDNCGYIYRKAILAVYNKFKKNDEKCGLIDEIYRINLSFEKKEKLCVVERKDEVIEYLTDLKRKGEELLIRLNKTLQERQQHSIIMSELSKI